MIFIGIGIGGIVFLLFFYLFFKKRPVCKDCNILLISLDTCAAKHMQCYGYERDTTPNLCQIGKEGVFFENAHSNATWTLPSHTSIFTGMFPFVHKITKASTDYLDQKIPLLPEILQKNGYETYFFAINHEDNFPATQVYNRGISHWDYVATENKDISKAIQQLTINSSENKKSFIFFHTYACHGPYFTSDPTLFYTKKTILDLPLSSEEMTNAPFTEALYQYLLGRMPLGLKAGEFRIAPQQIQTLLENLQNAPNFAAAKRIYDDAINQGMWGEEVMMSSYKEWFSYWGKIDSRNPAHIEYIKALYDSKMHEMDEEVLGVLHSAIDSAPWKKDTIVIITADHGEEFMEHGVLMHATLYDYNTQVPLIFLIPGVKSTSIREHVQSVDIAPTILDLVGIKNYYSFNGKSLTPLLNGVSLGKRLIVAGGNANSKQNLSTIREGDWKLFVTENEDQSILPYALYNTKSDPGEQSDLLAKNMQEATQIIQRYKALKEKLTPKDEQAN